MIAQTIATVIFREVLDRIMKADVPVNNSQAREVAQKVTDAVAPVVVNASNAEPWYRSRIYWGLIVAGVGMVGSATGAYVIPGEEIDSIVTLILEGMEWAGLAYATYGRLVGAKKKPL